MRCFHCAWLLVLCAAIVPVCASGVSFTVDQISGNSLDGGYPGDSVQVSARVSFDATGKVTFRGVTIFNSLLTW